MPASPVVPAWPCPWVLVAQRWDLTGRREWPLGQGRGGEGWTRAGKGKWHGSRGVAGKWGAQVGRGGALRVSISRGLAQTWPPASLVSLCSLLDPTWTPTPGKQG